MIGLGPFIPLKFDTSPFSLQRRTVPAAIALQVMSTELKQESDPIRVLVTPRNQQEAYERWHRLDDAFKDGLKSGYLKFAATPAAFTLSPQWIDENRTILKTVDFNQVKQNVRDTLEKNGFAVDAFQSAFVLLDKMQAEQTASGLPDWKKIFPEKSSWWFLINTFFSEDQRTEAGRLWATPPTPATQDPGKTSEIIHRGGLPDIIK